MNCLQILRELDHERMRYVRGEVREGNVDKALLVVREAGLLPPCRVRPSKEKCIRVEISDYSSLLKEAQR